MNPVSTSSVALWEAGTTGYGTGATQLGTATSAGDGSFTIALICPSASAQIYLTAQGGNAGGGSNSSLMMMAALGPCSSISTSTPVFVNEVTTAGSVYALAQFLSTTSSGTVGAPSTNATGLANAFANAANLVDVTSGAALSTTPGGAGTAPQQNLDSIANALADCVQTDGASSAGCTELFDCALPGAVFSSSACTGGTGSVADTLAATLSIALNPAGVSVAGVNDVATKAAVFSPALALAPNDWSMQLNFAPSGSNFNSQFDVAIDSSGHVWVTNSVCSSHSPKVTALNNDGTLFGSFAPSGSNFNFAAGVAIDSSDHVWVANNAIPADVVALNNAGTLFGSFAPKGSNFSNPTGVAIDSSSHVWVTNEGGSTITALNNDGTLLGNFTNSAPVGANFNVPTGVAIDGTGHGWVANFNGATVTALNNNGTLLGNFFPTGSNFSNPNFVAIDGSGHVWVTNSGTETITALNNDGTLFGNFSLGPTFTEPLGLAIDSSGNVWVTNGLGSSSTVTELVGAAAPVKTPFIGPPQLP